MKKYYIQFEDETLKVAVSRWFAELSYAKKAAKAELKLSGRELKQIFEIVPAYKPRKKKNNG